MALNANRINLSATGSMPTEEVRYPPLDDFLKITQLSQYSKKLKKLKALELEDIESASVRSEMLHVEQQRVRRYMDWFDRKILTTASLKQQPVTLENFCQLCSLPSILKQLRKYMDWFDRKILTTASLKQQPVTLENFCQLCSLPSILKQLRKFGCVEFDDLPFIAYGDLAAMLPKKVELYRFKRYIERVSNFPDLAKFEAEAVVAVARMEDFLIEASLKQYIDVFKKMGVVEAVDFFAIKRLDVPKMKQVEYDRFVRHRETLKDVKTQFEQIPVESKEQNTSIPRTAQSELHHRYSIDSQPAGIYQTSQPNQNIKYQRPSADSSHPIGIYPQRSFDQCGYPPPTPQPSFDQGVYQAPPMTPHGGGYPPPHTPQSMHQPPGFAGTYPQPPSNQQQPPRHIAPSTQQGFDHLVAYSTGAHNNTPFYPPPHATSAPSPAAAGYPPPQNQYFSPPQNY